VIFGGKLEVVPTLNHNFSTSIVAASAILMFGDTSQSKLSNNSLETIFDCVLIAQFDKFVLSKEKIAFKPAKVTDHSSTLHFVAQ